MKEFKKFSIPDSDMVGWINTLREGGFNQEELDDMMAYLNETYKRIKGPEIIERELDNVKTFVLEEYGHHLNKEQIDALRKEFQKILGI